MFIKMIDGGLLNTNLVVYLSAEYWEIIGKFRWCIVATLANGESIIVGKFEGEPSARQEVSRIYELMNLPT